MSNLYTLSGMVAERRADLVVNSILKYVTDIDDVKGLGFCVSIAHAQFMARYFNTHGIPSMALTGDSPDEERNAAKQRLVSGELRFLFVVDIYNEGVDIPEVNTVLFLRPTESLTVFLQQLGRGLRLAENKDCLTVLDFIGQANKKYNFEEKFAALLSNTTRSVSRELKEGFVSAPKGCYIQLEKIAAKYRFFLHVFPFHDSLLFAVQTQVALPDCKEGYPVRTQFGDRDLQILHNKGIALGGDSIQLLHDPAADRNTVRFQLDVKEFRKILQADGAVHAIGILVQLFKIFLHLVVFVPNFTNQFFQNILHRNNTKRSAEIIYDHGDMG